MSKQISKQRLFLELALPNSKGFSRKVYTTEFVGRYARLKLGNGLDWGRSDGKLGTTYNLYAHKEKGKIVWIQLQGLCKFDRTLTIQAKIKKAISKMTCSVTGIKTVQPDHRDGRRDHPRVNSVSQQLLSDFQPLSPCTNYAKREHCRTCRATNKRFDAKMLGFEIGWIYGNEEYKDTCIGCYWYDVKGFHRQFTYKDG